MIKDSIYIQGLVDYILDVKPYSSKLIDVAIEYLFSDSMTAHVSEKHAIEVNQKGYWVDQFTFDGSTLIRQIPAILFPRTSNTVHQTYHFVVGTDEARGLIDEENPDSTLPNAFRVKGNAALQVFVNGTPLQEGTDYRISYSNGKPIGPANSVFQFLSGKNLPVGTALTVDVAVYDRIFISLSNFNAIGIETPNAIGAVWNNPTSFVPYRIQYNAPPVSATLLDSWGGSYSLNSNDPSTPPAAFDIGYDNTAYDANPFAGNDDEDLSDYQNGIANWDVRPWDGQAVGDFYTPYPSADIIDDTYVISGFNVDQYGTSTPILSEVPNRTGVRIGTVKRNVNGANSEYYTFEFNPEYLADHVPVGTFVQLDIDQRETLSEMINARLGEFCFISDTDTHQDFFIYDTQNFVDTTQIPGSVTGDFGYDDISPLSWTENGYSADPYDGSSTMPTVASTMVEQLSITSQRINASETVKIFSLSLPSMTRGNSWTTTVTNVDKVIINHYFGEKDPLGEYAHVGGVRVIVEGAEPLSVTNPYLNNNPQLFNTTEITFNGLSTATITIVKP